MTVTIRDAGPADIALLDGALRALSADLGDHHRAGVDVLARACHGDRAFAAAVLALAGEAAVGAALFSPLVSTTLGGAGVMVSDLWVAEPHRGSGLGRRLLAAVARAGAARWGCTFLRLSVYDASLGARGFYDHLGFVLRHGERNAVLSGERFADLAGDMP